MLATPLRAYINQYVIRKIDIFEGCSKGLFFDSGSWIALQNAKNSHFATLYRLRAIR